MASRFGRLRLLLSPMRHGRLVSLALLALSCLALYRIDTTPLANLHDTQFDRYQRQMPRPRDEQPVIVVEIDSRSLAEYGQWPWSRSRIAELVQRILVGEPMALGLDLLLSERDHYSPEILAEHLPAASPMVLQHLPDPDAQLALALSAGPTVLALSGVAKHMPGSRQPQKPLNALVQNDKTEANLMHYAAAHTSLPMLEQAAHGEGFINSGTPESLNSTQARGVLRRVPTLALIDKQPFLSLPLEMVRLALGEEGIARVEMGPHGVQRIHIGAYSLPTQPNGQILLHFGKANSHYYLSATDILAGRIAPETFASRLVLIGFNASGLQDRVITPLGDSLPGVDIHVQVIESLLAGAALQRPAWLPQLEVAALALSGLLLIGVIPAMRPRYAMATFVGIALFWITAGYIVFYLGRWLFDGPAVVLLLSPVFVSLLIGTWIIADEQRRSAEDALQTSREEAARMSGELNAARRIQMGLLPDPAKVFAREQRFEVAALLEPARAVGGDYYDCFALDAQRLCFAIADVSGKGLPASLFMAVSKTLTGALARRTDNLGEVMREVEAALNRENPEFLFVTAFVGVLDVETGQIDFVRAGHDAPLLLRNGQISRIDAAAASGPPLCAVGDFAYQSARAQLQTGDLLCLFTDGVTEASNGKELFGIERLVAALQPAEHTLQAQATHLRDVVRTFEAGEPPADDLTLLLLRWHGPTRNCAER
jgi:serine phosphatase RsbU (regulator of sigma subunit)/CHASE2 domain-containing sensor protein